MKKSVYRCCEGQNGPGHSRDSRESDSRVHLPGCPDRVRRFCPLWSCFSDIKLLQVRKLGLKEMSPLETSQGQASGFL